MSGWIFGWGAYLWWGFAPIYFKYVAHISPLEILAHRVVWSCLLLTLIIAARKTLLPTWSLLKQGRVFGTLIVSTLFVSTNWLIFIYAVAEGYVIQASLGYFINPLINVALGVLVLKEKLSLNLKIALVLATAGVLYQTFIYGELPVISLVLAITFAFYGLIRKQSPLGSQEGLWAETMLLLPVALVFLAVYDLQPQEHFVNGALKDRLLLFFAGPVTAIPLLLFAAAARRLEYSALGFLQYLAPSLQLLLAVYAFGEVLGQEQLISFSLIWAGLVVFVLGSGLKKMRSR